MADYTRTIGTGDVMMIRDTGYNVEFWFHSDQYTWNNQQRWGQQSNGAYTEGTFKLNSGGAWHHIATVGVGSTQDVLFRMFDSGLGWPTYDFWQRIDRATVPPAPTMQSATALGTSSVRVLFNGNGDGGTPVREWQIGYGTSSSYPQYYVGSDGSTDIGGLAGGTTWYFWARGRNDVGWSGWSGRASAFTWRVPDAPSVVTFDLITQTSVRSKFTGGFNGGESVDEWQLSFGLDSGADDTVITDNDGLTTHTDLQPGQTYYFKARGRNAVGWGPFSAVRSQTLRAGALVKDNNVWKRALPYVKVNGVWKLVKPYVKQAGVWKETS